MTLRLPVLHGGGGPQHLLQVLHEGARLALRLRVGLLPDPVVQVAGRPLRGLQVLGNLGAQGVRVWVGGRVAEDPGVGWTQIQDAPRALGGTGQVPP